MPNNYFTNFQLNLYEAVQNLVTRLFEGEGMVGERSVQ